MRKKITFKYESSSNNELTQEEVIRLQKKQDELMDYVLRCHAKLKIHNQLSGNEEKFSMQ